MLFALRFCQSVEVSASWFLVFCQSVCVELVELVELVEPVELEELVELRELVELGELVELVDGSATLGDACREVAPFLFPWGFE